MSLRKQNNQTNSPLRATIIVAGFFLLLSAFSFAGAQEEGSGGEEGTGAEEGSGAEEEGAGAEGEGFREGNGLYGNAQCGELTCEPNEVCQKTFGGFNDNDVIPPNPVPPEVGARDGDPSDGPDAVGDSNTVEEGGVYDDVQYRCVKPPVIEGPEPEENKYRAPGGGEDYNNANFFASGQLDPGVPVNIINQDALPVDIFNPKPLPTHITSPNPIPVTVVDDLALYQQKELIDKPLANKQKSVTIGEVNKQIREDINSQELVKTPADLKGWGIDYGTFDPETGAVPIAERKYAEAFVRPDIETVRQKWQEKREITQGSGASALPYPSFEEIPDCSPEAGDLDEQGLQCSLAGLAPKNNTYGQTAALKALANQKVNQAQENLNQEQAAGDGFLAKSQEGIKNPFLKVITSPGNSIEGVVQKTLDSTIDQTIVSSESCFSSIPKTVKDGTLKPLLEEGLFNTSEGIDFTEVLSQLYNALLGAIDCELQNEISSSLDGVLQSIGEIIF